MLRHSAQQRSLLRPCPPASRTASTWEYHAAAAAPPGGHIRPACWKEIKAASGWGKGELSPSPRSKIGVPQVGRPPPPNGWEDQPENSHTSGPSSKRIVFEYSAPSAKRKPRSGSAGPGLLLHLFLPAY